MVAVDSPADFGVVEVPYGVRDVLKEKGKLVAALAASKAEVGSRLEVSLADIQRDAATRRAEAEAMARQQIAMYDATHAEATESVDEMMAYVFEDDGGRIDEYCGQAFADVRARLVALMGDDVADAPPPFLVDVGGGGLQEHIARLAEEACVVARDAGLACGGNAAAGATPTAAMELGLRFSPDLKKRVMEMRSERGPGMAVLAARQAVLEPPEPLCGRKGRAPKLAALLNAVDAYVAGPPGRDMTDVYDRVAALEAKHRSPGVLNAALWFDG